MKKIITLAFIAILLSSCVATTNYDTDETKLVYYTESVDVWDEKGFVVYNNTLSQNPEGNTVWVWECVPNDSHREWCVLTYGNLERLVDDFEKLSTVTFYKNELQVKFLFSWDGCDILKRVTHTKIQGKQFLIIEDTDMGPVPESFINNSLTYIRKIDK